MQEPTISTKPIAENRSSYKSWVAKRKSIVWTVGVEPLIPEMHPSKLKLAAIDPSVGEELSKYSKEFREIYFR